MKIDITLEISQKMLQCAKESDNKALEGHLGTHFDVMDKVFPLEYTERKAIVFDVSQVKDRDIDMTDIDFEKIEPKMFVAFYSGFIESEEYGTHRYFKEHPQLSNELINALVEKGISIVGLDFAGIRRGKEHTPTDQVCADKGVFIIENLCNLKKVLEQGSEFIAHTYPMPFAELTGLPCRIIAEI